MKKHTRRLALALGLAVAAVGVPVSASATTTGDAPDHRLMTNVACVIPDFPVMGSGWKIDAAIANWNQAQSVVRVVRGFQPGCSPVYAHRYDADDKLCGYADTWGGTMSESGTHFEYEHADIWLNNNCAGHPKLSKWVVAHELGHAFGLYHTTGPWSVMSYDYRLWMYKGEVMPTDSAMLTNLYNL